MVKANRKKTLPLFERIGDVRARTAAELPELCELGAECIKTIKKAKDLETVEIKYKTREYIVLRARVGKSIMTTRPVRKDLFIWDEDRSKALIQEVRIVPWDPAKSDSLEQLIYTMQQAIAMYLDLFHKDAAPRVVGTFFEAVIACSLNLVSGLVVISGTVRIPDSNESIRTDLGLQREAKVILLAATKTSTRERLSQPFVQKRILDQTLTNPPKSILIVVGDLQRLGADGVQHTFTAGQFLLYWKYIANLDGVYYIDVPPQAESKTFGGLIKRLQELFRTDLDALLNG